MKAVKLAGLEPAPVFGFFEAISSMPHGSWNTTRLRDWLAAFAKERNLRCICDEGGNVVIFKEASPGYEDHPILMMQSHLDMVCEKDVDCPKNMDEEGLDLTHDDEFVWAKGTSLGADDALGIAYILAVLDDDTLPHPALEAIFTDEEEVGMGGAKRLDCSVLQGRRMLNMDTFGEGVFTVGCAGGAKVDYTLDAVRTPCEGSWLRIDLENFAGGHSGATIHLNHTNCIKELAELLSRVRNVTPIRLSKLSGGAKANSIPRESFAVFAAGSDCLAAVEQLCAAMQQQIRETYDEPSATVAVRAAAGECEALSAADTDRIIDLLRQTPNGLQKWSEELPDVVQTSLNVGCVRMEDRFVAEYQLRSSVNEEKEELKARFAELAEQFGFGVRFYGENPAWPYQKESPLRTAMADLWKEMFGREPVVKVQHVGLECGLFAEKISGLEAVSTCSGAFHVHTNKEKMSIPSAQRFWPYLRELITRL